MSDIHNTLYGPLSDNSDYQVIADDADFGCNVRIGSFVVIEERCRIGNNTMIANSTILRPGTVIGDNCKIGHLCVFEGETVVGDNCVIQSQSHITRGAVIGDCVFIGPHFTSCNDSRMCHMRMQILKYDEKAFTIERGARIGSNVLFLPGVKIGENAVVGAGSMVRKNVGSNALYYGSPAVFKRQVPQREWI